MSPHWCCYTLKCRVCALTIFAQTTNSSSQDEDGGSLHYPHAVCECFDSAVRLSGDAFHLLASLWCSCCSTDSLKDNMILNVINNYNNKTHFSYLFCRAYLGIRICIITVPYSKFQSKSTLNTTVLLWILNPKEKHHF